MALIKCPKCKREISDKAKSCPNCGNPIAESIPPKKFYQIDDWEPQKGKKGKRSATQDIRDFNFTPKAILFIVGFFLILAVVLSIIWSIPRSPSIESDSPYTKGYAKGQAIALVSLANFENVISLFGNLENFKDRICEKAVNESGYTGSEADQYRKGAIAGFEAEAKHILKHGKPSIK